MALFEMGRFDESKAAFVTAQKEPEGRATATRWLAYVEREQERLRELGLN